MSHMCSCTHPKPCCFLFSRIAGNVGSCVNFSEISLLTISLKKKQKKTCACYGMVFAWEQTYLTELLCSTINGVDALIDFIGCASMRLN